jgi:hypothetical protein
MPARPRACSVLVTRREAQVLSLLAQGFANEEIGVTLDWRRARSSTTLIRPRTSWMFIPASFWPLTGLFLFSASAPAGMMASSYRKASSEALIDPSPRQRVLGPADGRRCVREPRFSPFRSCSFWSRSSTLCFPGWSVFKGERTLRPVQNQA